jgi:Putative Actinobacterial Holin-X, holin superfamily III
MSPNGQSYRAHPRDQPIGELVKRLATETSTLVRQELDLGKAEMTERGQQAGKGAGDARRRRGRRPPRGGRASASPTIRPAT